MRAPIGKRSVDTGYRGNPVLGPVFFQNGPEHLIEIICAATHGAAQDAFLHGAELAQRAVGASVLQQHARLETMRADRSERERADEPGRVEKNARAARRRLQRRFPLGCFERGIELAYLDRADERTAGAMRDDVRKRLARLARARYLLDELLDGKIGDRIVETEVARIADRQQIDERRRILR